MSNAPARWELVGRGLLLLLFGALLGQAVTGLPVGASLWGAASVAALWLLIHAHYHLHRWLGWVRAALTLIALAAGAMAAKSYSATGYKLEYRICGRPIVNNIGELIGFHLEVNPRDPQPFDLYFRVKHHSHSFNREVSTQKYSDIVNHIPSNQKVIGPRDGETIDDNAMLKSPMRPQTSIVGEYHFTLSFGLDEQHLDSEAEIYGLYEVSFEPNGKPADYPHFSRQGDKNIIADPADNCPETPWMIESPSTAS